MEVAFLRSKDFTVFVATATTSTLDWPPIKVLAVAQVASLVVILRELVFPMFSTCYSRRIQVLIINIIAGCLTTFLTP